MGEEVWRGGGLVSWVAMHRAGVEVLGLMTWRRGPRSRGWSSLPALPQALDLGGKQQLPLGVGGYKCRKHCWWAAATSGGLRRLWTGAEGLRAVVGLGRLHPALLDSWSPGQKLV